MQETNGPIAVYCKAQTQIMSIDKEHHEKVKELQTKIKTCRTIIQDELEKNNISCFEVVAEGEESATYFRIQRNCVQREVTPDIVQDVLQRINVSDFISHADKCGYVFSKMLSSYIYSNIRELSKNNDKCKLTINNTCERGFVRSENNDVNAEVKNIALELLTTRKDLKTLKQNIIEEKTQPTLKLKNINDDVIKCLKESNPDTMTQKVHVMQGNGQETYYLRCKEKEQKKKIGVKKAKVMLEEIVNDVLDGYGLSRDFSPTTPIPNDLWDAINNKFVESYTFFTNNVQTKITKKLSLDKLGPRKSKISALSSS